MRTLPLLLSLVFATATAGLAQAPTPAPAAPRQTTPPAPAPAKPPQTPAPVPAKPPQTPRRAPANPARSGIAMVVTDDKGATLGGVHVELTGPVNNSGETNPGGQINFPGLQAGTYRLRFTGNDVIAFEREVTVRAGAIERFEIKLSAAPEPPAPPPPVAPPPPPAAAVGPTGAPQLGSLTNLADRERNTKEARREILLSCSGNTRNMLVVLTEEQPQRIYDMAEATYYVIAGQGGARIGNIQSVITPGSFISVPRGTPFTIARQGNRPLAMLWSLSGEPCEQAR